MFKNLGKIITKSLVIGMFIGLGIFITFAADIINLNQTVETSSRITKDWFNAVNNAFNTFTNNITNINSNINTLSGNLNTTNSNINTLNGNLSTTNSNINTLSGNLNTINSNVNALSGKVQNVYSYGSNVGIGVTSPTEKLHVNGSILSEWDNATSKIPQLNLYRLASGVFDGSALTVDIGMGMGLANIVAGAKIDSGGASYNYLGTRGASRIEMGNGYMGLEVGGTSGTEGSPVTFNRGLTVSSNSNVGIGTTSPSEKLEVAGTAKATRVESNGSYVLTTLSHCGGACASYHAINTRVNVGAYNYTWTTPINTDTVLFTSNNKGTITVNKAGLYLIKINIFMIPSTERSRLAYGCPFINGVANCGSNSPNDFLGHGYFPAGRWGVRSQNVYMQLSAGTTVSYGYNIPAAMNNWAHDSYTSMGITRIN